MADRCRCKKLVGVEGGGKLMLSCLNNLIKQEARVSTSRRAGNSWDEKGKRRGIGTRETDDRRDSPRGWGVWIFRRSFFILVRSIPVRPV